MSTSDLEMAPDIKAIIPIHRLFEEQVRRNPDALAVTRGPTRRLRYRELNARAEVVAAALRACGAGAESPVALCAPRSIEWLVGFLAVCKAGAAAVVLDPAWPPKRLTGSLASLGSAPVLATRSTADVVGHELPAGGEPLLVERVLTDAPRTAATDISVPVHVDNVAYLVPTSGSTGRPKLVGVTHRAVAHRVMTHRAGYRIGPGDRSSWLAPPGSSVSVIELWPYLATGASVHIAEPATVASPADLRDWMITTAITKTYVNMPLGEMLFQLDWPPDTSLALMTVGSDSVRVWPDAGLPFEVAVEYGSSEANGVTSCLVPWERRCTSATATPDQRGRRPPIGRPWPGVRIAILDPRLDAAPVGEIGELCVSGPELARGYVGEPARTAERFVPDPWGEPGSRMYRTGDLARVRADGLVEHHGRVDTQVKIDGYRVDPAEVEATLLTHPLVQAAVVIAVDAPGGRRRLAAYVVPRADGPPFEPASLRTLAAQRLPSSMVPALIIPIERLPLNASNKVDRARLPAPAWLDGTDTGELPADAVEHEVLTIWSQELGVSEPGMNDSFVLSGGDSLAAGKLVNRIRARFGVRLRLRDFFREPTPAGLARRVRTAQAAALRGGPR